MADVDEKLEQQAQRHASELREQAIGYRLDHIDENLTSVKNKVCKHVDDDKIEKDKILGAIAEVGAERRKCEERINSDIQDMHAYNHKTFVKKTDLRLYAALIVFAVSATVSVITWYGPQKQISDAAMNGIARTIIKELGR